jgi:predicted MFS family arabinose efflux permease
VRVLLALPLGLAARPRALFDSSEAVALAVVALGLSNGLLATRTMCIGPQLAPKELRGAAAGLTVLSLYAGIGLGALLGLAYGEGFLFRS